jgi:hypothetical protein
MAIWQFSCSLLPRAVLLSRFGGLPAGLPSEVVEDVPWWAVQQPPLGYESVIESFAPPAKSWSESIRIWGREGGDDVHVTLEGDRVVWISFRLDLREFSHPFAEGALRLADHCGCVLWGPSGRPFLPDWESLLAALRDSNSMRFVINPREFLEGLGAGKYLLERG